MIEFIFWIVGMCGTVTCKSDPTATPPTIVACMPEGVKSEVLHPIVLKSKDGVAIIKVVPEICPQV
jgi:hypothetical protein